MPHLPVIEALNLKKQFGDFQAVRGVNFAVQPGECFGLLGPNGAGKSTVINMLYGRVTRSSGNLTIFGLDPNEQSREIKRHLGVVTQENCLDESLTVRENMEVYSAFVNVERQQRASRISQLLEFMNLSHKENEMIQTLSGGMKRRLVFVRALLANPQLIILDEPTTGLDPAVRHLLWGRVNELKAQGKTILLTTHYMHEAEMLCDRVFIMNQGEIIAQGTPHQLRDSHTPGYVAAFAKTDNSNIQTAAQKLNYSFVEDSSGLYVRAPDLNSLLDFQKKISMDALNLRPSNLEDVFLKLTGKELNSDA